MDTTAKEVALGKGGWRLIPVGTQYWNGNRVMKRLNELLRLGTLFAAVVFANAAHALGVGEVSLNSRLNQPLNAQIALFEANGLDAGEVTVRLASQEAFERVGLDRPYFLTDLKFTPKLQGAQGSIAVTSSKPVREPYLSFLIEVIWPNGRMLREYTLLLDPPVYAPAQTAVATPQIPVRETAPPESPQYAQEPGEEPSPAEQPLQRPVAQQPVQRANAQSAQPVDERRQALKPSASNEYQTQSYDTLWEIASNFAPPGATVQQTMLAIQELNPQAFINGNINLLKKGQVLRLPDEQQIGSRSVPQALRQVAEQNNAWRESRGMVAERQVNATRSEPAASTGREQAQDNLRLVSADSKGASANLLNERLAAAQENLDSSRRENAELKSRMSDLEDQLEKLQRLVELKDVSLANLQAQLAVSEGDADASMSASTDYAPASQTTADYSAQQPAAASIADSAPAANEDFATASSNAAPEESVAANTPAAAEEAPWWQSLLDNSLVLWGIGGAVLLLALLLLMGQSRRNSRKWAERELEAELATEEAQHNADFAAGLGLPDDGLDGLLDRKPSGKSARAEATPKKEATLKKSSALPAAAAKATSPQKDALDELLQADTPKAASSSSKPLNALDELDDFSDFDLKFGDEAQFADKAQSTAKAEKEGRAEQAPSLDLPDDLLMHSAHDKPVSSTDKDDELDFLLDEKSSSEPTLELDDFGLLSDEAALAASTPQKREEPSALAEPKKFDESPEPLEAFSKEAPKSVKEEVPQPEFQTADEDFDFLSGTDETETKLDLARAYIDMGDMEGARDILDEVLAEGSDSQQAEARELMNSIAA